ncbi:MAG: hypothetical protein HOI53_03315 [Francisellaceae bacterium]|nr:hypothetical protein [Francisellaceae bacterium]
MPLYDVSEYVDLGHRPPLSHELSIWDLSNGFKKGLGIELDDFDENNLFISSISADDTSDLRTAVASAHQRINAGAGPQPILAVIHFAAHYYSLEISSTETKVIDLRNKPRVEDGNNPNQAALLEMVRTVIGSVNFAGAGSALILPAVLTFRDSDGMDDVNIPTWDGTSCGFQQLSYCLQKREINNEITVATNSVNLRTAVEDIISDGNTVDLTRYNPYQCFSSTIADSDFESLKGISVGNIDELREHLVKRQSAREDLHREVSYDDMYHFSGLNSTVLAHLEGYLAADDISDDDDPDRALALSLQEEELVAIRQDNPIAKKIKL